jgi:hypothetical protein
MTGRISGHPTGDVGWCSAGIRQEMGSKQSADDAVAVRSGPAGVVGKRYGER